MRVSAKRLFLAAQQLPRFDIKDTSQPLQHIHRGRRSLPLQQANIRPIHLSEVRAGLLRQAAFGPKPPQISRENRPKHHATSVISVDFFTTEYILQLLWKRADARRLPNRPGGKDLRILIHSVMVTVLPPLQRIRAAIRLAMAGTMVLGAAAASAQSVDDPFGTQKAYIARKMIPVCTNGSLARAFALEIFGHHALRSATDDETRAEEALAEELTSKTFVLVKSARWEGSAGDGACHLDMEVTLPPEYVSRLGGDGVLRGDMWFNLESQDTGWKLISITDSQGAGDNSFRRFLAPNTNAIIQARLTEAKEAGFAVERQRLAKERAVAKQRSDQAAAARRAWIRAHPAQYAAQQRAEANRRAAQAADERRRRLACEAHGGTWGQRITELYPACFFRTER